MVTADGEIGRRWDEQKVSMQYSYMENKRNERPDVGVSIISLIGAGTVLRLERDVWSMAKWLRQATTEYAFPPRPVELTS